jgi:SulP family sulfate permease
MIGQYLRSLRKEFADYKTSTFVQDLLAGITVGTVSLPLALAFGVVSGSDAAAGLITAIFSGIIIGLLGGASFQISGPTGTMVAILIPISHTWGIKGVVTVTFLSGLFLLLAGFFKVGRVVSIIPSAVITGFTTGISILIAFSQIDNFFGTSSSGDTVIEKIGSYITNGFAISWQPMMFGLLVIAIMVLWPKEWALKVPSSLVGIIAALILNLMGPFSVVEVGSIPRTLLLKERFSFFNIDLNMVKVLILPAMSVAALGMIESLLCGAVGQKMTKERFYPDRQLLGQGIGNVLISFLGGVPATAAIARTSVAIRAGSKTRLTSVFHSLTLLAFMFFLGPLIGRIPLAALAGVLMVTSWRMNDWPSIKSFFSNRFKTPIAQFFITMAATVVFDLTMAILIGIGLSMFLFVYNSASIEISVSNIDERHEKGKNITKELSKVRLVYVTGQLFFGSQEQLVNKVQSIEGASHIVLSIRGVPSVDHSAMLALEQLHKDLDQKGTSLLFCGIQPKVKKEFIRWGFDEAVGYSSIFDNAVEAIDSIVIEN